MNARAFSLDSFKPVAGRVLQEALNRVLRLDVASLEKLNGLQDRRIELHLQSPDIALAVEVRGQALQVGPVNPGREPDISFKSTLSGILKSLPMFAQGQPAIGAMRISGDVELARLLQELVKEFDPDWQEPFVKALGPVFGPQAAKFIREGLRQAKTGAGNFMQSGAEYVTEEARVVVSKAELDDFNTQVDKIRQRGDRLQARVNELLKGSP
ncbi:MAG: SCP2 sterol-binding domain-containing protein [Arenimonas sp.]|nr:SCP2 sterol-binding domain-containing protein [Arenimonas sp.]MBP7981446.1 SCP2 sterol-binding domain-containing protein [Arenimonas sp.]